MPTVKCILAEQGGKGGGGTGTSIVLRSLEVTIPPTKTSYLAGETFNPAGMVVTASYGLANSAAILTTAEVTGSCTITPQPLVDGTTAVTISYGEGGINVSTTQAVTVTHRLESIAVTTNPTKVTYEYGDTLVTTGIVVTATYSDNKTATVTANNISPSALSTVGTQAISVTYTENGVTKTTTFNVTVNRKSVAKPTWKANIDYTGSSQSVNTTSYWNNFNTTAMTISGTYSGTNAGTYTATFKLGANYRWADGTTTDLNVDWTINKIAPTFSLSATSMSIDASNLTRTITITTNSDGTLGINPTSVTGLTTLSLSGKTITATGNGSTAITSATITVSLAAGTNWTATSKTFTITATYWEWGSETATADAAWWTGLQSWIKTASTTELANCVGKTKSVTLTSKVLGTDTHLVRCIGYNINRSKTKTTENTLTFETANALATTTVFGSSNGKWTGSTVRT